MDVLDELAVLSRGRAIVFGNGGDAGKFTVNIGMMWGFGPTADSAVRTLLGELRHEQRSRQLDIEELRILGRE